MLTLLIAAPPPTGRWGAIQLRQSAHSREHFRRGNASASCRSRLITIPASSDRFSRNAPITCISAIPAPLLKANEGDGRRHSSVIEPSSGGGCYMIPQIGNSPPPMPASSSSGFTPHFERLGPLGCPGTTEAGIRLRRRRTFAGHGGLFLGGSDAILPPDGPECGRFRSRNVDPERAGLSRRLPACDCLKIGGQNDRHWRSVPVGPPQAVARTRNPANGCSQKSLDPAPPRAFQRREDGGSPDRQWFTPRT